MAAVLQVATPEGASGRIVGGAGDYRFRYHDEAKAQAAISLLMPVRLDEYRHRELHPIFQMNLPEGYVLEQLRNRLAKVADVVHNVDDRVSEHGRQSYSREPKAQT
jgi:serine/threonine-protein kinase HipA